MSGELVWPSGKQRDLGSNPLRLSFLLKCCGLGTLSCDFVPHAIFTYTSVRLPGKNDDDFILFTEPPLALLLIYNRAGNWKQN